MRLAWRAVRIHDGPRLPRPCRRSGAGVSGKDRRRTSPRRTTGGRMNAPRRDFPLLESHPDLHYLDSAATTQKPRAVLDAMMQYYTCDNANPHRGAYALSVRATERYHDARERIARFVGVRDAAR